MKFLLLPLVTVLAVVSFFYGEVFASTNMVYPVSHRLFDVPGVPYEHITVPSPKNIYVYFNPDTSIPFLSVRWQSTPGERPTFYVLFKRNYGENDFVPVDVVHEEEYIEWMPEVGAYEYSVIAIDEATGSASPASNVVSINVDAAF